MIIQEESHKHITTDRSDSPVIGFHALVDRSSARDMPLLRGAHPPSAASPLAGKGG